MTENALAFLVLTTVRLTSFTSSVLIKPNVEGKRQKLTDEMVKLKLTPCMSPFREWRRLVRNNNKHIVDILDSRTYSNARAVQGESAAHYLTTENNHCNAIEDAGGTNCQGDKHNTSCLLHDGRPHNSVISLCLINPPLQQRAHTAAQSL